MDLEKRDLDEGRGQNPLLEVDPLATTSPRSTCSMLEVPGPSKGQTVGGFGD